MAGVTLEHITKVFRNKRRKVRAVDDLNLGIDDREFVVLVGPSGCGKTTTLRLIAGLEELCAGTIRIGELVVNDVSPKDRDVAMVFQNYALYPHMTVFRNMAFGLKMRRTPRDEIKRNVGEVARLLHLEDLLDRKPAALSGGERQRVALGRAIVRRPKVFLFDEPLSNLDARLRVHMRTELKSLHRNLATTMIYVTHDQEEAMTLGSRIVILKDGRIQQCGAPLAVYNRPVNRFVAGFIGTPPMNFLQGRLEGDGGTVCFVGDIGRVVMPPDSADKLKSCCGRTVVLGVRPEHLRLQSSSLLCSGIVDTEHSLTKENPRGLKSAARCTKTENALDDADRTVVQGRSIDRCKDYAAMGEATVLVVEPLGDSIHVHLAAAGGANIVSRVPPDTIISPGDRVKLSMDISHAHVFAADESGKRLN